MENKIDYIKPTLETIDIEDIILDEDELIGVYASDS